MTYIIVNELHEPHELLVSFVSFVSFDDFFIVNELFVSFVSFVDHLMTLITRILVCLDDSLLLRVLRVLRWQPSPCPMFHAPFLYLYRRKVRGVGLDSEIIE